MSDKLKSKIKVGDFEGLYDLLQGTPIKDSNKLFEILYFCYKYLREDATLFVDFKSFIKVVNYLSTGIFELKPARNEQYVKILGFIVKYLMDKDKISLIIPLSGALLPQWYPYEDQPKSAATYKDIYSLLAYIIQQKRTFLTNEESLTLIKLLLEVAFKTQPQKVYLECLKNLLLVMINQQFPSNTVLNFFRDQLDRIDIISEEHDYTNVFSGLTNLYKYKFSAEVNDCLAAAKSKCSVTSFKDLLDLMAVCEKDPRTGYSKFYSYYKLNGLTSSLIVTCKLITVIFSCTSDKILSAKKVFEFLTLIEQFAKLAQKQTLKCKCSDQCQVKSNLAEALEFYLIIYKASKMCLGRKDAEMGSKLKCEPSRFFDNYIEIIKSMQSQECKHFKKQYVICCDAIYSLGISCYKNDDLQIATFYLKKYLQASFLFVDRISAAEIDQNHVAYYETALTIIARHFEKSNEPRIALSVLAVACFFNPNSNSLEKWLRTKVQAKENTDIQKTTIVQAIDGFQDLSKGFFGDAAINLQPVDKANLLTMELKLYESVWKSKLPMVCALNELVSVVDVLECARLIIEIWQFGSMGVYETFLATLKVVIKKLENYNASENGRSEEEKLIALAHLYFLYHKYHTNDAIKKNCDEIESAMLNFTSYQAAESEVTDPEDKTDIIPTYSSLKLNFYMKFMKSLDLSFEIFEKLMPKLFQVENDGKNDQLLSLLIHLGHEYYLHNHKLKSLIMLKFALRLAEELNDKKRVIQCSGWILEQVCEKTQANDKLYQAAEKCAEYLESEGCYKELFSFYLSKAEYLLHFDFEAAKVAFDKATDYGKHFELSGLCLAEMTYIKHKLLTQPCRLNESEHQKTTYSEILNAQSHILNYLNSNPTKMSYAMVSVFKIQQELTKMYVNLNMARECVAYTKNILEVAQQMILPFRVTELLSDLCCAAILYGRYDDCQDKLDGLATMVGISRTHVAKSPSPLRVHLKEEETDGDDLDEVIDTLRKMTLEVPTLQRSDCGGSPAFAAETFKFSSFLNHAIGCQCFNCGWLELQKGLLERTMWQGCLHLYRKDVKLGLQFLNGALKVYNVLREKNQKLLEDLDLLGLMPDSTFLFKHCYLRILKELGDICLVNSNIEEAEKINNKLMGLIDLKNVALMPCYNNILVQKLTISEMKIFNEQLANRNKNRLSVGNESERDVEVKTPETKQTQVNVIKVKTPMDLSPLMMPPKKYKNIRPMKCNFLDDLDSAPSTTPSTSKNEVKKLSSAMKTPAPKLKVYTEKSSTMSTRRKIPLAEAVGTPQMNDLLINSSVADSESIGGKKLVARSKLLTEKLKKSTRKQAENSDESASERKESVRTNLMAKLDNLGDDQGSVRRSARRRIV